MLMYELSPVYYHLVLRGENHGVLANRSFSFNYDLDRANLAYKPSSRCDGIYEYDHHFIHECSLYALPHQV